MSENKNHLALSLIEPIYDQLTFYNSTKMFIDKIFKKDVLEDNIDTNEDKKNNTIMKVIENPSIEDLKLLLKDEKYCFNFNNKNKSTYVDCHKDEDYYIEYYKTFGKPEIYGLYETNNDTKISKLIGSVSLINRYDNKVCHIMDLKILKKYRGIGGVNKFIMSTLFSRMFKYNGYYCICMNNNTIVEKLANKIIMPKMSNRGNMLIYLVSFDEMNKILPILSSFYCSDIAFINTKNARIFIDCVTKKAYKILHLHHNADYREEIDYHEIQKGYQYCFSIHESNKYIIQELKTKYNINSSSTATVYSNDFKADWSKFVKTFEI
jgi:hypothetical protein